MSFLDPTKPIATCTSENCDNCAAGEHVHCHFRPKELFHFCMIAFPTFLVGGGRRPAYRWLVAGIVAGPDFRLFRFSGNPRHVFPLPALC